MVCELGCFDGGGGGKAVEFVSTRRLNISEGQPLGFCVMICLPAWFRVLTQVTILPFHDGDKIEKIKIPLPGLEPGSLG